MSDNTSKKDFTENIEARKDESFEMVYLTEKLGVTMNEIKKAIEAVGNDRHKVEGYLRTHRNK